MSSNDNVSSRTPTLPVRLADVGDGLLEEARGSDDGHAAVTLTPAAGGTLSQTVIAMRADASLEAGRWNGPATVQVLQGTARVEGAEGGSLEAGSWTVVDGTDGAVVADGTDAVVLLTVVPDQG